MGMSLDSSRLSWAGMGSVELDLAELSVAWLGLAWHGWAQLHSARTDSAWLSPARVGSSGIVSVRL